MDNTTEYLYWADGNGNTVCISEDTDGNITLDTDDGFEGVSVEPTKKAAFLICCALVNAFGLKMQFDLPEDS